MSPTKLRIVIIIGILLVVGSAVAEEAVKGNHLKRGMELYEQEKFAQAAGEFEKAYDDEPRSDLLFAWAQSERRAGNCTEAAQLYRRYMAQARRRREIRAARTALKKCRQAGGEEQQDDPDRQVGVAAAPRRDSEESPAAAGEAEAAAPGLAAAVPGSGSGVAAPRLAMSPSRAAGASGAAATRAPVVGLQADRSVQRSWQLDKLGASLVGSGVALTFVGLGFYSSGSALANNLDDDATHDVVTRTESASQRRRLFGAATGTIGVVAVTLGILRYRQAYRAAHRTVSIQPFAGADSVGASIGGTF